MSLTPYRVGQSKISFIFSSSILILSGPITTPKNPTSLTFYLYFSGFIYQTFSTNLFTTSFTSLLCSSFIYVPTIMLFIKLTTFPVLIKLLRILFIMAWNIVSEFVSSKNIIVGLNNPSGVVNIIFHLSSFFICILL